MKSDVDKPLPAQVVAKRGLDAGEARIRQPAFAKMLEDTGVVRVERPAREVIIVEDDRVAERRPVERERDCEEKGCDVPGRDALQAQCIPVE